MKCLPMSHPLASILSSRSTCSQQTRVVPHSDTQSRECSSLHSRSFRGKIFGLFVSVILWVRDPTNLATTLRIGLPLHHSVMFYTFCLGVLFQAQSRTSRFAPPRSSPNVPLLNSENVKKSFEVISNRFQHIFSRKGNCEMGKKWTTSHYFEIISTK